MTMTFMAPIGAIETVVLTPNPKLQDPESIDHGVNFKEAMDGTFYTTVFSSAQKLLTYDFESMGKGKLVELEEFFKLYAGKHILITDYRGESWDVVFTEDTLSTVTEKLAKFASTGRQEAGSITLEFTGVRI